MACDKLFEEPCNCQSNNTTDNSIYEQKRDAFVCLKDCDELVTFLKDVAPLHQNIYHITTMHSLASIIRTKTWKFASPYRMNDLQEVGQKGEKEKWDRIFSTSFFHGDSNNMGMWKMYGGCCYSAVCLEFPGEDILKWEEDIIQNKKFGIDECFLYSVFDFSVSFHDIAYIHGYQKINGEKVCWGNIINNKIAVNKVISPDSLLTGYVKNSAWEQEKETRIMIELPLLKREDAIYVPTHSVLNHVKVHFSPFIDIEKESSVQIMKDIFIKMGAVWPKGFEDRCFPSYFRKLTQ